VTEISAETERRHPVGTDCVSDLKGTASLNAGAFIADRMSAFRRFDNFKI
jgi:hypothetical protein